MNKGVVGVLKWAAVIFVLVYLGVQVYSGFVAPVTTDTVYPYTAYTGYETDGFVIRNETVINETVNGVLSFDVADGGRVSKGGTIAKIYPTAADADNRVRAEELDGRIATLQKIQTYNDLNAADLSSVTHKISEAVGNVTAATQNGKVSQTDYYDILLENMARRQIITGQASDFNGLISSLKAERDSLNSSAGSTGKITSPSSGYVIYSVDGYENAVNTGSLETLNAETLAALTKESVPSTAVCKIVGDYEWYIAATVTFAESLNLKQGGKVTLKTGLSSVPELSATVKCINKQSVGDKAVVVFTCDAMNSELAQARTLDMTIVVEEHKGLKVDNRAIRHVDGQKGVYVLLASQVKFVPVEVIWSGENYSIVKQEATEKKVLRIYDEIVVKGKNLYDGKIID